MVTQVNGIINLQYETPKLSVAPCEKKQKVSTVLNGKSLCVALNIASLVRQGEIFFKWLLKLNYKKQIFHHLKPLSFISGITSIIKISKTVFESAKSKVKISLHNTARKIADLISNIGSLGDSIATVTGYLSSMKIIAAVRWLSTLSFVSLGLQVLGIALDVDSLIQARKFGKELKKETQMEHGKTGITLEQYKKGIKLLEKHENRIESYFHEDKTAFVVRLGQVENEASNLIESGTPENIEKGQKLLQSTMKTLHGRISTKKFTHVMSIIASVISSIAVIVLLCTPLGALGAGLLFTATLFGLGIEYIYQRNKDKAFEKEFFNNKLNLN